MKLTRKELRQLIEAFIAGPDGRVRKLTGDPFAGEDTEHPHADDFIQKSLDKIDDPELRSMIDTFYAGSPENKHQAIDLAASLTGADDPDVIRRSEDSDFDLDTVFNPAFNDFKDVAYQETLFDPGLLKTYLNYLYRKRKLIKGMSIYDIYAGFEKMYPYPLTGYGPTMTDLRLLGIDFNDDETVKSIDPEKFKL
jgi:hypothetical protein